MRDTLLLKALFPQQTHQSEVLVDLPKVEDRTVVHPDHRGRVGVIGRTNAALSHPVHRGGGGEWGESVAEGGSLVNKIWVYHMHTIRIMCKWTHQ